MSHETMDLEQLAVYLQRDVREVSKLASRGHLPGQKVGGQWRFAQAEINHWIETQMHAYTEQQLTAVEAGPGRAGDNGFVVMPLLSEGTIAVPLAAGTRASVLQELVRLAEGSWQVYDGAAMLTAVRQREDMASTALESGVAIPHPHRPLPPTVLGESLIAFGRTATSIPFGPRGAECDLFFLVCCSDQATHLRVLARISRMMLRPGFIDILRSAASPSETYLALEAAERDLVG
jgi:PTS system nitrogen regulatory IIA component